MEKLMLYAVRTSTYDIQIRFESCHDTDSPSLSVKVSQCPSDAQTMLVNLEEGQYGWVELVSPVN